MLSLITGGAGFIGSHLAEALVSRGDQVVILDDLSTGTEDNIHHLRASSSLRFLFGNVLDRRLLAQAMANVEVVFHLAAAVGVRQIIESPVRTIETNVKGTEYVLEAAAKKKTLVFIASTSEVYGKNNKIPFCEDDDVTLGPTGKSRWSYAASKLLDEFLALAYWKEKKLPVVIGRLFNTVGPRQTGRYGMVLPTFVNQALEGEPLTVYGSGQQRRCFAEVGDVVEAILKLVAKDRALGQVVNIGNDQEISMEDLAKLVKQKTESSSPIRLIPYDQAYEPGFEDMDRRVPSLEKLTQITGYRPSTSLHVVVGRVAEYFRSGDRVTR